MPHSETPRPDDAADATDRLSLAWNSQGLVAAAATSATDGRLLMVAWMNEAAFTQTLETGIATYWSRSRGRLWVKGETSGAVQKVREIRVDCDQDAVELVVEEAGPACHTGRRSCFYRRVSRGSDGRVRLAFHEN